MRLTILLIFTFILGFNTAESQSFIWTNSTSEVLPAKAKEIPLFGVKRIGLRNDKELQIHPIFFFLYPHVGLKKQWGNKGDWTIGSYHSIAYPSLLLKSMAREGTGGILPKTSVIPQIITTKNEVFATKMISNQFFVMASLGVELAASFGDADFPTIDFPFAYRRTAVYHDKIVPKLGIAFGGHISAKVDFMIDVNAYKMFSETGGLILENKAFVFWRKSDRFGLKAGFATAFGRYPYGLDFRIMPALDLVFSRRSSSEK